MEERSNRSAEDEKKEEFEKLIIKPLPSILAEMQEAIKVAVESAKRAEETAKIAKESSEASRKGSEVAAREARETEERAKKATIAFKKVTDEAVSDAKEASDRAVKEAKAVIIQTKREGDAFPFCFCLVLFSLTCRIQLLAPRALARSLDLSWRGGMASQSLACC